MGSDINSDVNDDNKLVIDYALQKGKYCNFCLTMSRENFDEHQKNPSKWWYQDCCKKRFLEELIPSTFEESDKIYKSRHKNKIEFVIYKIYIKKGSYITYLKIPFLRHKKRRVIEILTYNIVPKISEK